MLIWKLPQLRLCWISFAILTTTVTLTLGQVEVDFVDVWGDVKVKIGHEQNIGCQVLNGGPRHEIKWTLGEKILNDTFIKEDEEGVDGLIEEYVKFTPSLEDDEEDLVCSFGGHSDTVRLEVFQQDIEDAPAETNMFTLGEKNELDVSVRLYPAPSNDQVTWVVGEDVAIHPGQEDDIYIAKPIEKTEGSDNLYKFILEILEVNETVTSRQHNLKIVTRGNTKTIPFNIDLKPKVSEAGVPVWIWIIVVIVAIVILLVIFVIIRSARKKETTTISLNKKYDAVRDQGSLPSTQTTAP